jgi:hypothetical protein
VGVEELAQDADGVRVGNRVRVHDEHVVAGGRRGADVRVRRERERPLVVYDAYPLRQRPRRAPRDVRDDDELVDLRDERGQRALELVRVTVRDDDGRDGQSASR